MKKLRKVSDAPILMVEAEVPLDTMFRKKRCMDYVNGNKRFYEAYKKLRAQGITGLYYLPAKEMNFTEESMIEGTHPNDFGNRQYADAYLKKIKEMFNGMQARGGASRARVRK